MSRTISEVAAETGLSADTLRYYEKIRLLPAPGRTAGGKRLYRDQDVARLRFIQRAKSVGFSLAEIGKLLRFRENPVKSSRGVREIAATKHAQVKEQLALLHSVEAELDLLLQICRGDSDTCPILTTLDGDTTAASKPGSR
ncbi:MAG: heavy metal-responsive transcriptional regulator [Woeseia sp.]